MSFDKARATQFRQEILPEINEILKKHGMFMSVGTIYIESENMRSRIELRETTPEGEIPAREVVKQEQGVADFNKYCEMFGLKKEDLNKWIKYAGGEYQIIGLKKGARKNNIYLVGKQGGRYVAPAPQVVKALGR